MEEGERAPLPLQQDNKIKQMGWWGHHSCHCCSCCHHHSCHCCCHHSHYHRWHHFCHHCCCLCLPGPCLCPLTSLVLAGTCSCLVHSLRHSSLLLLLIPALQCLFLLPCVLVPVYTGPLVCVVTYRKRIVSILLLFWGLPFCI